MISPIPKWKQVLFQFELPNLFARSWFLYSLNKAPLCLRPTRAIALAVNSLVLEVTHLKHHLEYWWALAFLTKKSCNNCRENLCKKFQRVHNTFTLQFLWHCTVNKVTNGDTIQQQCFDLIAALQNTSILLSPFLSRQKNTQHLGLNQKQQECKGLRFPPICQQDR